MLWMNYTKKRGRCCCQDASTTLHLYSYTQQSPPKHSHTNQYGNAASPDSSNANWHYTHCSPSESPKFKTGKKNEEYVIYF